MDVSPNGNIYSCLFLLLVEVQPCKAKIHCYIEVGCIITYWNCSPNRRGRSATINYKQHSMRQRFNGDYIPVTLNILHISHNITQNKCLVGITCQILYIAHQSYWFGLRRYFHYTCAKRFRITFYNTTGPLICRND